ncbi:MAG: T9SS type A sorting domain-containing protein [Aureispira sp.]|nr:T9SS type A sorting domain-containing protein [Aureispira sp.]
MTLNFNYIEGGEGTIDDALLIYSIDNGASWLTLSNPAKTALCGVQGLWTAYSIALPATCENITGLRVGFRWYNNDGGGSDPSFAVDDINIVTIGGGGPSHTWEGTVNNDWHTAANWSAASVPTSAEDVLVPTSGDLVGTFMPTISAAAVAKNVCNFGTIIMTGNNTLTIDEDLLNEGVVTTDNVDAGADVIFANTASIYKGKGTMYDVDVAVTSSDLTLENNITPRSFIIATPGTVDLATYTLSINKNLTKTAGTFNPFNGEIHFIDACGTCVDMTSTADIDFNTDQTFGNVLVNKTNGVKTSIIRPVAHSFTSPKMLSIYSGILDANANTLNGNGHLTMKGGELQLAKNATALPELTGNYSLKAGQVTLDGANQIIKSVSDLGTNYHDLEFAGTGIKTFSSDNVNINNQLFLSLPTGLGNYVNTGINTCQVFNSNVNAVVRTGGHIVGNLGRNVIFSDTYVYDVGSDNIGGDTYYEPITITTKFILGPSNIIANFNDNTPNPTTVSNVSFLTQTGARDTIKNVEQEGYWHLSTNNPLTSGNYQASVSPSSFWSLTKPWAQGNYALLKQDAAAQPWDFTNGGIRVNDSTTTAFSNFSNYALAYTDSIIPDFLFSIELIQFTGKKTEGGNVLRWETAEEIDNDYFELQRSTNGLNFSTITVIEGVGNSTTLQRYQHTDRLPNNSWNYYRLKQVDKDKTYQYSNVVALDNRHEDVGLRLMPNPAKDQVTFDYLGADINSKFQVRIFDVNGRKVLDQEYTPTGTRIRETISTRDLARGVYIVQFANGAIHKTQKLILID